MKGTVCDRNLVQFNIIRYQRSKCFTAFATAEPILLDRCLFSLFKCAVPTKCTHTGRIKEQIGNINVEVPFSHVSKKKNTCIVLPCFSVCVFLNSYGAVCTHHLGRKSHFWIQRPFISSFLSIGLLNRRVKYIFLLTLTDTNSQWVAIRIPVSAPRFGFERPYRDIWFSSPEYSQWGSAFRYVSSEPSSWTTLCVWCTDSHCLLPSGRTLFHRVSTAVQLS